MNTVTEIPSPDALSYEVAEKVLGYRWWRYETWQRDASGDDTVVRSLQPPTFPSGKWKRWSEKHGLAPATGEEPLHVAYGTWDLNMVTVVPPFAKDDAAALSLLDSWEGDWELRRQNDIYRMTLFRPSEQWEGVGPTRAIAICNARLAAAKDGRGVAK